jgi:UDP-N-acetylglucosamine acyltransferase
VIDVHPTAVIHPSARLGDGVRVGPYAVVGEHCRVGDGTVLGAHAVIESFTTIGQDCQVFTGAVVGAIPQDLKFGGEESYTVIGDRNVIREFVTINRATGVDHETRIGDDNLLMAYVHIAHDCQIGNRVVLANGVTLAGHVEIEDHVSVGGLCGIHQFVKVGTMAFIGAMTRIVQDVPPYMLAEGTPPKVYGPNVIGLRRRGLEQHERTLLKRAYKLLYRSGLNVSQAVEQITLLGESPYLARLVDFLARSERGLVGKVDRSAEPSSDS